MNEKTYQVPWLVEEIRSYTTPTEIIPITQHHTRREARAARNHYASEHQHDGISYRVRKIPTKV